MIPFMIDLMWNILAFCITAVLTTAGIWAAILVIYAFCAFISGLIAGDDEL